MPDPIFSLALPFETVDHSIPLTGTTLRPPSRQPLNLDFSDGLEYWSIEESVLWLYEYGVDSSALPHAATSAYLKTNAATSGDSCTLQQMVDMGEHKGQHIRFQAMLKTQDVEPQASLFIGSPFIGVKGDRIEKIIKGTSEWTSYTLIWQVPQDLYAAMSFGIALRGKGQLWLKDVSIEVMA